MIHSNNTSDKIYLPKCVHVPTNNMAGLSIYYVLIGSLTDKEYSAINLFSNKIKIITLVQNLQGYPRECEQEGTFLQGFICILSQV